LRVLLSGAEHFYLKRLLVKMITVYCGKNTSGPVFFVLTITSWKPKTKDYNIAVNSRIVIFVYRLLNIFNAERLHNRAFLRQAAITSSQEISNEQLMLTLACHPAAWVDVA
jgi:hypothetical protein